MIELSDPRPCFRVASFGLPGTMQHVAQLLFAHARRNPYRFQVSADRRLDQCDVALVDMTVRGNDRLLRVLKRRAADIVTLTVGRRGATDRDADDLLLTQFHTRLLSVLNQAVTGRVAARDLSPRSPRVDASRNGSGLLAKLDPAAAPAPSAVSAVRSVWGRAPRALILDPSATARMQLMSRLSTVGWEVQGASTLAQSRAWLSTWPVDLVISDWMLEDGPSVLLKDLRLGMGALRGGPADWVLLTHRLGWWDALRARSAGCSGMLNKPTTPQAMYALTDRTLRDRLLRDRFMHDRLSSR